MFLLKAPLFLIFIAVSAVDATPLSRRTGKATLALTTRINVLDTGVNIAELDHARAQALIQAALLVKRTGSVNASNIGVISTVQIGIGKPATEYTLVVDTGSSNTWIGADQAYVKTGTSQDTGDSVSCVYGSASFFGEEWTDTVTLAPDLVITKQSIGVASNVSGISNVDGILGLGPTDLTGGTVTNTSTVPTVTDNLYTQGTISEEMLGVYYVPVSENDNEGGLTFGGYDSSVITSEVNYVPLTTISPASYYWGINQSITYGDTTVLSNAAGIVDAGTTLIAIASDAFANYQKLTGATKVTANGLYSLTYSQYDNLQSLWFHIGDTSYELTPNGQIWPRSLNYAIGGSSGSVYLIISDLGSPSGRGLDFINGFAFMERFYSVFDTTNRQVGFATTQYTYSTSN